MRAPPPGGPLSPPLAPLYNHAFSLPAQPPPPPRSTSLCYSWSARQGGPGQLNSGEDVSASWRQVAWRRPAEFLQGAQQRPALFHDGISPGDVDQGELGDCYLLSALAVLAERQEAVRGLFVEKKCRADVGLYVVRLCIQGHWREARRPADASAAPPRAGPFYSA